MKDAVELSSLNPDLPEIEHDIPVAFPVPSEHELARLNNMPYEALKKLLSNKKTMREFHLVQADLSQYENLEKVVNEIVFGPRDFYARTSLELEQAISDLSEEEVTHLLCYAFEHEIQAESAIAALMARLNNDEGHSFTYFIRKHVEYFEKTYPRLFLQTESMFPTDATGKTALRQTIENYDLHEAVREINRGADAQAEFDQITSVQDVFMFIKLALAEQNLDALVLALEKFITLANSEHDVLVLGEECFRAHHVLLHPVTPDIEMEEAASDITIGFEHFVQPVVNSKNDITDFLVMLNRLPVEELSQLLTKSDQSGKTLLSYIRHEQRNLGEYKNIQAVIDSVNAGLPSPDSEENMQAILKGVKKNGADLKPEYLFIVVKQNWLDARSELLSLRRLLDVNVKDEQGKMAIDYAHGCLCQLELIGAGADIAHFDRAKILSLVCYAVQNNYNGWYLKEIKRQTNICFDKTVEDNEPPIHTALTTSQFKYFEYLLTQAINVDARNAKGWTPLHVLLNARVVPTNMMALIASLLDKGADVNAVTQDNNRATPLHLAAMNFSIAVTQLLLARGAVVDAKAAKDRTPCDVARSKNNKDVEWCLTKFIEQSRNNPNASVAELVEAVGSPARTDVYVDETSGEIDLFADYGSNVIQRK